MNILDEESRKYLSQYMIIDNVTAAKITNHINRYRLNGTVIAWYKDKSDFYHDWIDVNHIYYDRAAANKRLHGGHGEFMSLSNGNIIRFLC